jgi:hypothetical protein
MKVNAPDAVRQSKLTPTMHFFSKCEPTRYHGREQKWFSSIPKAWGSQAERSRSSLKILASEWSHIWTNTLNPFPNTTPPAPATLHFKTAHKRCLAFPTRSISKSRFAYSFSILLTSDAQFFRHAHYPSLVISAICPAKFSLISAVS